MATKKTAPKKVPKKSGHPLTASLLALLSAQKRQKFLQSLTPAELEHLQYDWRFWARPAQLAPPGNWINWLVLAGRGFGKTRTGAEWVREKVDSGQARKIALIGSTNDDVRNIMVEGTPDVPGLLDIWPPSKRPVYVPSKRTITFWTGAKARTYSAEKAARLRGPQHDLGWCDELAAWEEAGKGRMLKTWTMFKLGLRKGPKPQCCITTTPKPLPLIQDLVKDPDTVVTRGSMMDNWANLADSFRNEMLRLYRGTHTGRQELDGDILTDVEGALWILAIIEAHRVKEKPEFATRTLVGVDPSVAGKDLDEEGKKRDDCGIVVSCRVGPRQPFAPRFVLGDFTINAGPEVWAVEVVRVFWMMGADAVVAESNNGGDLVRMAINAIDPRVPVILRPAGQSKTTRAEPVAMAYARGEVHHVGAFPELESEMCTWVNDGHSMSPNRIDALVWSMLEDMQPTEVTGIYV